MVPYGTKEYYEEQARNEQLHYDMMVCALQSKLRGGTLNTEDELPRMCELVVDAWDSVITARRNLNDHIKNDANSSDSD